MIYLRKLIKNYIEKLTLNDLKSYAYKYNISLNNNELEIILFYLKNNLQSILYDDESKTLEYLEDKINNDAYLKIKDLFLNYKHKYQSFL